MLLLVTTMEDLLKKAMAGVDEDQDIVPKLTERTAETSEETTFASLE